MFTAAPSALRKGHQIQIAYEGYARVVFIAYSEYINITYGVQNRKCSTKKYFAGGEIFSRFSLANAFFTK